MFPEISFTDPTHTFDYKIEYDEINNCTHICVTHTSDFFKWSKTIADDLTENVYGHIKIVLTPKDVYNIFCKFHNKSLSANYKIILPEKYKHATYPLSIEIQIKFEHNDEFDTRTITIEPEFIPFEQIIISQLEWRDKLFQSRMDKRYKQFELSLNERDKQIEELATEIWMLHSLAKTQKQIEEQFKLSLAQRDEQIEKLANEIEILHLQIETNETHRLTNADMLEKKVDKKLNKLSNSCVKIGMVYTKKETDNKFQISTKRLPTGPNLFRDIDSDDEDNNKYIFNGLPDYSTWRPNHYTSENRLNLLKDYHKVGKAIPWACMVFAAKTGDI